MECPNCGVENPANQELCMTCDARLLSKESKHIVDELVNKNSSKNIRWGLVLIIIGVAASLFSYIGATAGGVYTIYFGLIIWGIYKLFKGLI